MRPERLRNRLKRILCVTLFEALNLGNRALVDVLASENPSDEVGQLLLGETSELAPFADEMPATAGGIADPLRHGRRLPLTQPPGVSAQSNRAA